MCKHDYDTGINRLISNDLIAVFRYTHIVVDRMRAKHHMTLDVIFVATLEGYVMKYTRLPDADTTCLVEQIKLHDDVIRSVSSMELLDDERVLLVSTGREIIRLPLQRCHRHITKQ